MKELWKPLKGYENYYQVSNYGRIKSIQKNKLRKPNPDGSGYLKVDLYFGKHKTIKIHRAVAIAFIPNPHNYSQVNHKDGNIKNNHINNLEWCSPSQNSLHRIYVLNKNYLFPCKPIKCVELNKYFESIGKAANYFNIKQSSISRALNKVNYTSAGYHWITI